MGALVVGRCEMRMHIGYRFRVKWLSQNDFHIYKLLNVDEDMLALFMETTDTDPPDQFWTPFSTVDSMVLIP